MNLIWIILILQRVVAFSMISSLCLLLFQQVALLLILILFFVLLAIVVFEGSRYLSFPGLDLILCCHRMPYHRSTKTIPVDLTYYCLKQIQSISDCCSQCLGFRLRPPSVVNFPRFPISSLSSNLMVAPLQTQFGNKPKKWGLHSSQEWIHGIGCGMAFQLQL